MAGPLNEFYDIDARNDPFLREYEAARSLLRGSDWRKGLDDLEALAHRGSLMSMLLVADALRVGWGYDQELTEAETWYQAAVESGSARGLYGLGLAHRQMGQFSAAILDLEAAIAMDFPPAYDGLASMYFLGEGVPVDRQRALDLWNQGVALGHIGSKRSLLHHCLHGRYGFWRQVRAILNALPLAIEIVRLRNASGYTDRLR